MGFFHSINNRIYGMLDGVRGLKYEDDAYQRDEVRHLSPV